MLTVQMAGLANVEIIATLFDRYRQHYKQSPDLEGARKFITDRLTKGESVIFLAWIDGEPAGFTQLYPVFSSVNMCRAWILNDLYVNASSRRSGAGTALLAAAKAFALQTGANGLTLETAPDNQPARGLYERDGWTLAEHLYYWYDLRSKTQEHG